MIKERYFSQSKNVEKEINKYLLKDPNKEEGTYIDIGCGHPVELSNTYYYYLRGWKGLVVDPCDSYRDEFKKFRRDDIFIYGCIGDYDGEGMMYGGVFSQSPIAGVWKEKTPPAFHHKVNVMTMSTLIEQHPEFKRADFLSLDVEASEEAVLAGCDFWENFQPQIIIIEWKMKGIDKNGKLLDHNISYRSHWEHYLKDYYDCVADLGGNGCYVRKGRLNEISRTRQ